MLDIDVSDDSLRFKNPEAEGELKVPVMLVGTINFEDVKENVRQNLSHPMWLNRLPEREGIAILCGNGPSLSDTLDEIKSLKGTVFACNDSANFLIRNGVEVDHQVIMEATPAIVNELADAKGHLFSSSVPHELFKRKPQAVLWNPDTSWIEEMVPKDCPDFTFICGSISVGIYAMSICHVMGFREIHVFGFDSSFRDGNSHASGHFDIPGRLLVGVHLNGKTYKTSFDMKEQAKHFLLRKELLERHGCKVVVHGSGLLPDLVNLNTKEN